MFLSKILKMPKRIRFYETGGVEVLKYEEFELAPPSPDEAQIRHEAIGMFFTE